MIEYQAHPLLTETNLLGGPYYRQHQFYCVLHFIPAEIALTALTFGFIINDYAVVKLSEDDL